MPAPHPIKRFAKLKDLVDQRFGRLLVMALMEGNEQPARYLCLCDCNNHATVDRGALRGGRNRSCGCLQRESRHHHTATHGMSGSAEFRVWSHMRKRCSLPTDSSYPAYGGRGIRVCDRWQLFKNFMTDMGQRPTPHHSIERIDNDGNYEPINCRWATWTDQCRNRRNNQRVTWRGETHCISEWVEITGLSFNVLRLRAKRGWTPERMLTEPERHWPVKAPAPS